MDRHSTSILLSKLMSGPIRFLLPIFFEITSAIEELQAPDFKGSDSTSKVKQRAEERDRIRDASNDPTAAAPNGPSMKGMQHTFAITPPSTAAAAPTKFTTTNNNKPTSLGPSVAEVDHRMASGDRSYSNSNGSTPTPKTEVPAAHQVHLPASPVDSNKSLPDPPLLSPRDDGEGEENESTHQFAVRFPSLFSFDFNPTVLLGSSNGFINRDTSRHSLATFGEDIQMTMTMDGMDFPRPTFEFPLDELMDSPIVDTGKTLDDSSSDMVSAMMTSTDGHGEDDIQKMNDASIPAPRANLLSDSHLEAATVAVIHQHKKPELPKLAMPPPGIDGPVAYAAFAASDLSATTTVRSPSTDASPPPTASTYVSTPAALPPPPPPLPPSAPRGRPRSSSKHHRDDDAFVPPSSSSTTTLRRHTHSASVSSVSLSHEGSSSSSTAPTRRNSLKTSRYAVPSATPPPRSSRPSHGSGSSSGKSECANCGATSTPLWRRGLNDELNCNVSTNDHPTPTAHVAAAGW